MKEQHQRCPVDQLLANLTVHCHPAVVLPRFPKKGNRLTYHVMKQKAECSLYYIMKCYFFQLALCLRELIVVN